jgi:asparagine synthase (glutamine-hydrolysing)
MGALVAILSKKGEDATQLAITMLETLGFKKTEAFGIASPRVVRINRTVESLRNPNLESPIVIGNAFSRIRTADRPQPLKLKDATVVFEGGIYKESTEDSDAEIFARKTQQDRDASIENFIRRVEGDFAFVVAEAERLIAGRDPLGVCPIYYGENTDWAAMSSVRRALFSIGIQDAFSFPPGQVSTITKSGFTFKPIKTLAYSEPKPATMRSSVRKLHVLLRRSILERVSGLKEVALAFSGGLDSSVVANLAKDAGAKVHLIHVSLANQPETEHAIKVANELKLPIHTQLHSEKGLEEILPKVLWLIEESDPVKASIGIPMYWTAEKAAELNFKVMLAGQGADELFGGYKRHLDAYLKYGTIRAHRVIFQDIAKMSRANCERDLKICNYHGVDLRLPFASYEIARFAIDLPVELKMERSASTSRKLVLRQLAKDLGLAEFIAERPKKAIQYTTGVSRVLKKLAKRNGLTVNGYLDKIFRTARKDEAT